MLKNLFSRKLPNIALTLLLLFGMGQATAGAEDLIKGAYTFDAGQTVDAPNIFVRTDPSDTIAFQSGAVLDAEIVFTVPNLEQWEKWHTETGADPDKMADYGLEPLSALTLGNSGYMIVMEPGASIINRAEASDGIMALGSVEMVIGAENRPSDTIVHGDFTGIFLESFFDPEAETGESAAEPRHIVIVNHGNAGSHANKNLESSFGIWLAGGPEGDQFRLDNTGHIEGTESGFTVEGGFSDIAITNTGSITSGKLGLSVGQVNPQYIWQQDPNQIRDLIKFFSGQVAIDNHGDIIGDRFVGLGIWGDGAPALITNHETGLIKSDEVGIQLVGGGEIINKGVIEAGKTGIFIASKTGSITHSGTLSVTAEDGDAILFGPAAKGGSVTLFSSVDGNIRHIGDTADALVTLEDAGEEAFTDNIDLGGQGEIRQLGGTWSLKDVNADLIAIESGEMRPGEKVITRQGIEIGSDGRLVFNEGTLEARNLINRGVLDFTGGTITIKGELFDYAASPEDLILSGTGRPHLELISGATTDNIRVLAIGSEDGTPGWLTLKNDSIVSVSEKLTVGRGGSLEGIGTVDGNVDILSGGVVQPGFPVRTRRGESFTTGTLGVTGDLNIEDDSVISIKAGRRGGTASISVENDVSIKGGTVAVESVSFGTVPDGSVHTFLTAGGTMTGEFANIISLSPIYEFELGRTGNDMFFTATRLEDYADYARTANQRAVAGALSGARESEQLEELVWRMERLLEDILRSDGKDAPLMPATLDQLSPEPYHAAFRMNLVHASHMTRQMMHGARQSRLVFGTERPYYESAISGYALAGLASLPASGTESIGSYLEAAMASFTPRMSGASGDGRVRIQPGRLGASSANSNRRVFYGAYGRFADTDASDSRTRYRYKARGFYLGSERAVCSRIIVGANFGYAYTSAMFNGYQGQLRTDGFRIGPHASYTIGGFSLDLAASFGWHLNRQRRDMTLPSPKVATSRFDIYDGSGYMEARYEKRFLEDWAIAPMASVQYVTQHREGTREQKGGDTNLKIEGDSHESLRSLVGMGISRQIRSKTFIIVPELFAAWTHEAMDQDVDIDAAFAAAPGSPFRVTSEGLDRNSIIYGGGFTALFGEYNVAFLRYEKELIDEGDIDTYMFGVKWNF